MAPRLTIRGLAGAGAVVLTALALSACGSDGSISAGGPAPDETSTTAAPETTVPETTVAETVAPDPVLAPDAGVTATLPCDQATLQGAATDKYGGGSAPGFLVTDCVSDWAAGSTHKNFDPPLSILFHSENGSWVAVDRGNGMCERQGVPADVARQLGCTV